MKLEKRFGKFHQTLTLRKQLSAGRSMFKESVDVTLPLASSAPFGGTFL